MKRLLVGLCVVYVGLVILANWLAATYIIHVPLTPYMAPAGALVIGAILVLRDWIQQVSNVWISLVLVYIAGLISWGVGDLAGWTTIQKIAIASVVAFTASETLEALVFTPIRKKSLTTGVALSATIGNALDSYLFLTLAFGSLAFFWGQFWGKSEMIAVGVIFTALRRFAFPVAECASI